MTRVKVRQDGIMWQTVDGDLIVLDESKSTYLKLVGSGTELWPMLVAGADRQDLVALLVSSHGVSEAQAEADVDVFVTELLEHELVEHVSS